MLVSCSGEMSMGLPLGLYTHHYGKGCGKQPGARKCQYRGVNQVSQERNFTSLEVAKSL